MEKTQTLEDFYYAHLGQPPAPGPPGVAHFNVLRWRDLDEGEAQCAAYGRKQFYKISLLSGGNTYHYANQSVCLEKNVLLFNNPLVPYHWGQHDQEQHGIFCLFTEAFLPRPAALALSHYAVFQPGQQSVFQLTDAHYQALEAVFAKMEAELASDYAFKYDLLRHAALELIHAALRLQPPAATRRQAPAAARYTQEAQALLKHTRWTVSEIVWYLGFEELPHFINFFQKNAHTTPLAFRRAH